jgi:hypothetical protein
VPSDRESERRRVDDHATCIAPARKDVLALWVALQKPSALAGITGTDFGTASKLPAVTSNRDGLATEQASLSHACPRPI